VTLLGSCEMHCIEPLGYLLDLLLLSPNWPVKQVPDLAPASCSKTLERPACFKGFDADVVPQAGIGIREPEPTVKKLPSLS